jgi:hypothetical protein
MESLRGFRSPSPDLKKTAIVANSRIGLIKVPIFLNKLFFNLRYAYKSKTGKPRGLAGRLKLGRDAATVQLLSRFL